MASATWLASQRLVIDTECIIKLIKLIIKKIRVLCVHFEAEKIGLIPMNESEKRFDENEWSKVKQKYIERQDFKEPCVICKERLGVEQQVAHYLFKLILCFKSTTTTTTTKNKKSF